MKNQPNQAPEPPPIKVTSPHSRKFFNARRPDSCSGGTIENSPAIHCRGDSNRGPRPSGTAENIKRLQPSRWDDCPFNTYTRS